MIEMSVKMAMNTQMAITQKNMMIIHQTTSMKLTSSNKIGGMTPPRLQHPSAHVCLRKHTERAPLVGGASAGLRQLSLIRGTVEWRSFAIFVAKWRCH